MIIQIKTLNTKFVFIDKKRYYYIGIKKLIMSTESYFLIKIIPVLHQSNIMYGLIGELISADNNLDKESIKTNKKRLQNIITALDIMKNYEDCDIPVSDVNKYLEMAIKSMSIFDNEK